MQLVTKNGEILDKVDAKDQNSVIKIKTNTQLQMEEVEARRKLSDLPDLKNINVISQVLCYYMFGLSLQDIATITHLKLQQIQTIVMSQDFCDYRKQMIESIKENDEGDVRNFLSKSSHKAAEKIVDIMQNCANPKYSLEAAKDILDRSGQRPVDIVEHRTKIDNELRILYITKNEKDKEKLEEINTEYEEVLDE